jgi:lipoprotein-anchoring transpeptidase ErfK/SrfK
LSPAKLILSGTLVLFAIIGTVALTKAKKKPELASTTMDKVQEIAIEAPASSPPKENLFKETPKQSPIEKTAQSAINPKAEVPEANLVGRLFTLDSSKLPIVETITYTSRAPWLKGRPAWVADYASYYATSRHFIARSLNRKVDYFTQNVSPGDKFNVFKKDKDIQFYLVVDLSRCKMLFYYYDVGVGERVLLKTYNVGLGRKDAQKTSGFLTPTGKYKLGEKIAIYKPGSMGYFQDKKTEMIRVFGTRWIPFEQELSAASESCKGLGIHGSPWNAGGQGELIEDREHISKYDSDGCIRLNSEDVEELFSIIITKPTIIELVKDFHEATPPGVEKRIEGL